MLSFLGSKMRQNDIAGLNNALKMGDVSAVKSKAMQSIIKTGLLMTKMLWKGFQGTPKNIFHKDSRSFTYVSLGISIYISGTVSSIMRNSGLGKFLWILWKPEPSLLNKFLPQWDSYPQGLLA